MSLYAAVSVGITFLFLTAAVRSDLRDRTVPNGLWVRMGLASLLVLVPLALQDGPGFLLRAAVVFLTTSILAIGGYYARAYGGADAKAFMALALVFPTWPAAAPFPLWGVPESAMAAFPIAVFMNSVFLGLLTPIGLLLYNLAGGDRAKWMAFGYPVGLSSADPVRMKLLADPAGTAGVWLFGKELEPKFLEGLKAAGDMNRRVWVTPKMPFMLTIMAGLGIALWIGNLPLAVLNHLL